MTWYLRGDIIFKMANSAVGLSVIQFAKEGLPVIFRTNEMREKVLKFGAEEVCW